MPTYLLHGFRWSRPQIRIHIAQHDLDDCAAEWLIAPPSALALLNSLYTLYDFIPPCQQPTSASQHTPTSPLSPFTPTTPRPNGNGLPRSKSANGSPTAGSVANARAQPPKLEGFNAWSPVKLLEQHDIASPVPSQPYAYIGDAILQIPLSADVEAEIAAFEFRGLDEARRGSLVASPTGSNGIGNGNGPGLKARMSVSELRRAERERGWIEKLRDALQPGVKVGWYVVVCGDEERDVGDEEDGSENGAEKKVNGEMDREVVMEQAKKGGRTRRLRGLFGMREREKEGTAEGAGRRISKMMKG